MRLNPVPPLLLAIVSMGLFALVDERAYYAVGLVLLGHALSIVFGKPSP
jgi:hypothetical protein